ncbi:MAG TPA: HEPN domain-containing protein [Membranihabitans sp.]|nr:HEPN domain-containing protein [Membranihabitans sp.]
MKYSKAQLIKYRFDKAKEILKDAEILMENERWNSSANRLYYACFYAISAYLAHKGLRAITHSGLKSCFNNELVRPGKVSIADGKIFNKLFLLRHEADYEDFFQPDANTVIFLLPKVKELILKIENFTYNMTQFIGLTNFQYVPNICHFRGNHQFVLEA